MGWSSFVIIPNVVISELDWQKTTRRSISWCARAASRWILEKLKEERVPKVLKVQSSEETLIGPGRIAAGFFLETHHEPVYLLSNDVNLSIRGRSDYIHTLEPKRNWSSRLIANSIFGPDMSGSFNEYVQSVRPGRPSAISESLPSYEKMSIDVDTTLTEWIPSHALDDLHFQLVDHFTILLKELVLRVRPSVINSGEGNVSIHAAKHMSKRFVQWTAADCVECLSTVHRPRVTAPKLEAFLSRAHCRDMNARGSRRGQDWTKRQWEIGIAALDELGRIFGDQAICDSVEVLRIAVEDTFKLQLRPT